MIGRIENINLLSGFYGISATYKLFHNRASHAFVYKISGASLYNFNGREILLSQGEVLFIPKGETFDVKKVCTEESRYALINFEADIKNPVPFLYQFGKGINYSFLFDSIIKTWVFESDANYYNRLHLFYKLLFSLSASEEKRYFNTEKQQLIHPAIRYMNDHIFDIDLKTQYLHTLCNISDTYFRKIFFYVFGVSPKQYIINKRMLQAKNILESGEYNNIYEVSEAVGYSDALYFGKLFKKYYGYSPSKEKKTTDALL